MASLCHPWFTTTNFSYRFPIFETSATALCGTTGIYIYILCSQQVYKLWWMKPIPSNDWWIGIPSSQMLIIPKSIERVGESPNASTLSTLPTLAFCIQVDEEHKIHFHAEVCGLPLATHQQHPFDSLDLTAEIKPLKFHLASGPPLFFDRRLLTARCEYFQMLRCRP